MKKSYDCPNKDKYYRIVWNISENNAKNVSKIQLRGVNFHLDHIIPISLGYKYDIDPEIIGSIDNLRIISRKENFIKNQKKTELVELKLKHFGINISELTERKIHRGGLVAKTKRKSPEIKPCYNTNNKSSLFYYSPLNKLRDCN